MIFIQKIQPHKTQAMKFFVHSVIAVFILFSVTKAEEIPTRLSWPEIHQFPQSFHFEGEVLGYLSIFRIGESWYIYIYKDRESLSDHNEMNFMKLDYIEFGNFLKIQKFDGNENLLKSLDQRFVRVSGAFRKSEYSFSDVPCYIDKVDRIQWRGRDGEWTSDQKNGLEDSPLKSGKFIKYPSAVFFDHN